jgi:hypothetical protein
MLKKGRMPNHPSVQKIKDPSPSKANKKRGREGGNGTG